MPEDTAWDAERARRIVAEHLALEGPMLPILHALQEEFGHVAEQAVPIVAEALNLSRAEVHGVVTFYHDFRHEPAGRHVLKLCRGEACQSMGSEALAADILGRLGIAWHGTTGDREFTVEPVYCLGLCASCPSALIDDEPFARLDRATLLEAIDEVRGK